jgi:hypothetical protein
MGFRVLLGLLLTIVVAGCSRGDDANQFSAGTIQTPADPLQPVHIDRFLSIVEGHGGARIPEFTPPDEDQSLDFRGRASDLVSEFRGQFRRLFDVERQGRIWSRDPAWSEVLSRNNVSAVEFAALARSVSCAIMRVRLDSRVDMARLVANSRAEVDDLVGTMNAIDDIPEAERTRHDAFIRGQSALRLARAVALLEFAEMVKRVPAENCKLVRQYSKRLKPLVPQTGTEELLAELQQMGAARSGTVTPAGHETDAGE